MNNRHVSIALAAAVAMALLWLLLGNDEHTPQPASTAKERPQTAAVPGPSTTAPSSQREAPTAVNNKPVPAPSPAGPSAAHSPETRGMHGTIKELGGALAGNTLLQFVDREGVVLASTTADSRGRFAFAEPAPTGCALITRAGPAHAPGPRVRHKMLPHGTNAAVILWIPPTKTIEGSVLDQAGRPVADSYVATDRFTMTLGMQHFEILDGPKLHAMHSVKTDAFGHFVIAFAKSGKHRIRATSKGLDGSTECQAGDHSVVVQLGAHVGGDVMLNGLLRDTHSGATIAGGTIWVQRVRTTPGGHTSSSVAKSTSDAQGRYTIEGLDAGDYELKVRADGYAPATRATSSYANGRHAIDFAMAPARELNVRVVLPDGKPPSARCLLRVLDRSGAAVQTPGAVGILTTEFRVARDGTAKLRLLPAAPLTIVATQGNLHPAGKVDIDLSTESAPRSATIRMPTAGTRFARTHYFTLLGPDGKPAKIQGEAIAELHDATGLLSRVTGSWQGNTFEFGHEPSSFNSPTLAVGASHRPCQVTIEVPGFRKVTRTLTPKEKSPTVIRLRR